MTEEQSNGGQPAQPSTEPPAVSPPPAAAEPAAVAASDGEASAAVPATEMATPADVPAVTPSDAAAPAAAPAPGTKPAPRHKPAPGSAAKRRRPKRGTDFESLLLAELGRSATLRKGDRLRGRITKIESDHAVVDYGGASEAILRLDGVRDGEGELEIEVGQLMTLAVLQVGEPVVVGRSGRAGRERANLRKLFQDETPVEGKVSGTNKGGFDIQIGTFRAFCPISQIDILYCDKPQEHVGKQYTFKITEFKDGGRRFVVSRRALMEVDRAELGTRTREALAVGQELDGKVVRLQAFGAFVDIGGLEGLVHVSELRHSRVVDPQSVVSVGDTLRVKVIGLENLGDKGERISLSAKALQMDPWVEYCNSLHEGQVVQGKVTRLLDYGAFVALAAGIEGLVHITEFSTRRIGHPRDIVKEGQEVDAKVVSVDADRRRISLSLKDSGLADNVAPRPAIKVGTVLDGVVTNVKPYGVFVKLGPPAEGLDGMVPVDETDTDPGTDLAQAFPSGKALQAKVVRVDQQGRIRLSIRALHGPSAAEEAAQSVQAPAPSFGIMATAFKKAKND